MRPVNHVDTGVALTSHKDAKPNLIHSMGEFCAYCERATEAINLDVEHIKPQKAHSRLALTWGNFLLACTSCNTYKRHYQAANRQAGILRNQAWPHLDNTYSAYCYDQNGLITVSAGLTSLQHEQMAQRTLEMAGLDRTPSVAANYKELGLVYDIVSRRKKAWEKAQIALAAYQQNPTDIQCQSILGQAEETGFFSIWMSVFSAHASVKCELVRIFKASPNCFDRVGNPLNPRKAQRI